MGKLVYVHTVAGFLPQMLDVQLLPTSPGYTRAKGRKSRSSLKIIDL